MVYLCEVCKQEFEDNETLLTCPSCGQGNLSQGGNDGDGLERRHDSGADSGDNSGCNNIHAGRIENDEPGLN